MHDATRHYHHGRYEEKARRGSRRRLLSAASIARRPSTVARAPLELIA
jgi:hypothetical protein